MNADKIVLNSAIVTLGSTAAASMLPAAQGGKGELPRPRLLVGTALTFTGLSMLGDFAPRLAGPLAVALAVTALTYYGMPVAESWFTGNTTTPIGGTTP